MIVAEGLSWARDTGGLAYEPEYRRDWTLCSRSPP